MSELLLFNRQYETYTRRLLTDVDRTIQRSKIHVASYEAALEDLHSAVKFKNAVPCEVVFVSDAIFSHIHNHQAQIGILSMHVCCLSTLPTQI